MKHWIIRYETKGKKGEKKLYNEEKKNEYVDSLQLMIARQISEHEIPIKYEVVEIQ